MRARILIAEDDAILALRIQRTVEAMGHEVVALAATGEDAVRLTEEFQPDVALMDVSLRSEMTGVMAAAQIHARGDTPIIYVTAYSDRDLIEQAARTAPYAYLTKPIRERELQAAIEAALYRSRTDRALGRLNRVLRSVRDVNQLITRERDPQRLLEQACEILLQTSGYTFVWTLQPGAERGLTVRAHAGGTVALLDWAAGHGEVDGATPFESVLRTARPLIVRELPREGPEAPSIAGCVAIVPMLHADRVYGCLCVHATPREQFDEDEMDLLQELAGDLAFALRGLEEAARREHAERALAESNENWRRLVEYQPTGNVVHRNGTIQYANQASLRILGVAGRDELLGRDVLAFVHQDWREAVSARLLHLTPDAAPETDDVTLLKTEGQAVDVEMTSLPVTYLGQPAIQSVFWDVTERRRAEDQLRRAQKLDSVGRLAAGVAHDFNNMLQGIVGHAELLMSELHSSDARVEHVATILSAAQRCSDLSRQLLAFSRRQILDTRVVDLRDVVQRTQSLLRGTLHEDVRLSVAVSGEPCRVKADVGQLEQVVINLVVNAQDAMPEGGSLRIEVVPPSASRPRSHAIGSPAVPCVELVVADTGSGMDAFTREHAFEPFFTSKEPGKGTGLGLAMVHGIITQHGGSIQLDSDPGAGSTFTISLPACSDCETEPPVVPEPVRSIGTETVLVVEDTAAVLRVTVTVLRRYGYTVLDADSAQAALARLEHHEGGVDLLLTDVVMPDMNGKELAARIKARFPAVKVLFMSGHDMAVVANHGVLEDGVALIVKPFTSQELAVRIRRVLDGA
jgi:two-component system cell cycle sensor histidine kinase/response regulator CckA